MVGPPKLVASQPSSELATVRVDAPIRERDLGRRTVPLTYDRVFLPSFVIDHTELALRQRGAAGEEGFGVFAGTLRGGDAFVSTLVLPRIDMTRHYHGQISAETTATLLARLDQFDLVPIAQIHSHPHAAFLSEVDAQRPLVAVPGFLSIIVPDFGFVDLCDISRWRVYAFERPQQWRELEEHERQRRLIIDPSILRIP